MWQPIKVRKFWLPGVTCPNQYTKTGAPVPVLRHWQSTWVVSPDGPGWGKLRAACRGSNTRRGGDEAGVVVVAARGMLPFASVSVPNDSCTGTDHENEFRWDYERLTACRLDHETDFRLNYQLRSIYFNHSSQGNCANYWGSIIFKKVQTKRKKRTSEQCQKPLNW